MENNNQQKANNIKNIQQSIDENANGTLGTSLAEDTAINKMEAKDTDQPKEGTGIGGSDISGEDSDTENIAEKEGPSLTPVREASSDIIGGARLTDQLDRLNENANKQNSEDQNTNVSNEDNLDRNDT